MRPASHTKKITVPMSKAIDNNTCQSGGLKGNRAGITIGEKSGKRLAHTAKLLSGARTAVIIIYTAMMTGIEIGKVSDCASPVSSPTAEPTAAKSDEYKK